MPMLLFIFMGILQMGMIMQARNLTQYAVYRATRAGSLSHGECRPMLDSAIAALTPSFVSFTGTPGGIAGTPGSKLGQVFRRVGVPNKFDPALTGGQAVGGFNQTIVWIFKERPLDIEISSLDLNNGEYSDWDQANLPEPIRLETRMVYWYPMRLPMIDWVLSTAILSQWGLISYSYVNPYVPTQTAGTTSQSWSQVMSDPMATDYLKGVLQAEMLRRHGLKQYSFPILVSSRMRMMTPPRLRYFQGPEVACGFP